MTKKEKIKKCFRHLTKKKIDSILKIGAFLAILIALVIVFLYIPAQQLSIQEQQFQLQKNDLAVKYKKVDRKCSYTASKQVAEEKSKLKKKVKITDAQIKEAVKQKYLECMYFEGLYDPKAPEKEVPSKSAKEESKKN